MKRFLWLGALAAALAVVVTVPVAFAQSGLDGGSVVALDGGVAAQPAVLPDPALGLAPFAQVLLQDAQQSNWHGVVILLIIGLVWVVRTYGGKYVPFLMTDRGGALMALVTGVAVTLCNMAAAGGHLTSQVLIAGVWKGVTAAGGFTLLKRIVAPDDTPAVAPAAKA